MMNGYKNLTLCFKTGTLVFSEAIDELNGSKVYIEEAGSEIPSLDELVSLKNDYEITHTLSIRGALRSLALLKSQSKIAVAKEYFDGIPLSQFMKDRKLPLPQALTVAIGLAGILQEVHAQHIIHKDINPSCFLINPDTLALKLCRFGIATLLSREQAELAIPGTAGGSLPYISPEQTGRMNRSVDHRTDFYSLGVTLYQLFCGKLPFEAENAMELVHAHIAKHPVACSEVDAGIPRPLSDVVMKLLSKNAENRYQSAKGLIDDLNLCQKLYLQPDAAAPFIPGSTDVSSTFRISEKLYGRTEERKRLVAAFEEARTATINMVLVAGYSGVGKTRLINEIHKPVAHSNGYFAAGKFEQYNRHNPYSAIGSAFGALVRQFLAEPPALLEQWKQKITKILEGNGQVLADVIPDLELLVGKQPAVLKLGLSETQVRFVTLFKDLINGLASPEHPLVLFLDDLHWADSGSLDLLYALVSAPDIHNALIVGAYRDNEVTPSHPLLLLLDRLNENGRTIQTIQLHELNGEQVNQLVADSLQKEAQSTQELTGILMHKTGGNPFFINKFIQKLVQEQLIRFDAEEGAWKWDAGAIATMNVADNVVDLLIKKIQTLSPKAQRLLQLASCIGNRFELGVLSVISEEPETEVGASLWESVNEDLINPITHNSKHFKDRLWEELGVGNNTEREILFRFQHDRIQQAAYSLIAAEEKKKTHLQIGRLLVQKLSPQELTESIFDVLVHFNYAPELITEKEERVRIARLNYAAGERAKNSNSYQSALLYFQLGFSFIEPTEEAALHNDFLIARSECEYLCGNFKASEDTFNSAVANAGSSLEKAAVLSRKMQLYENTSRHNEAIGAALEGLRLLHIHLPQQPRSINIMAELLKVKFYLRNRTIDALKKQEDLQSPELVLAMKIMVNLWGPAYLHNQNLLAMAILRMVSISARYGNAPESALAYCFYGFICCAQLKDIKGGYEFGKLGIWLNEKFNDKSLRSKVYVIFGGCIAHWKDHFSQTLDYLRKAHEAGIEANDLIYAGYALNFLSKNHYLQCDSLDTVYEKLKRYIHFGRQVHHLTTLHHLLVELRLVCQLMDVPEDRDSFLDSADIATHEQQMNEFAAKEGVLLPITSHHIHQAEYCYLFEDYEAALRHLEKAEKHISSHLGLAEEVRLNFTTSMTLLALAAADKKKHSLNKVHRNQKVLAKWAANAPRNFEAKWLMVQAELAAFNGQFEKAVHYFSGAREAAQKNNLLSDLALANERAALFYQQHRFTDLFHSLMKEALLNYTQWHAEAKVRHVQQKLLQAGLSETTTKAPFVQEPAALSGTLISSSLDLQSIFKASTTISGEVMFEKLLEKLLVILLENAGAQTGCIVLVKEGHLVAVAEGNIEDRNIQLLPDVPIEQVHSLPQSILRFVFHTQEALIGNNPDAHTRFAKDEYLLAKKPKSVLCLPIQQHGNCIALIYLENNLATDVFTPERMEVLKLLSGQIAVSMQNAILYKEQMELSRAYQHFVPSDFISALGHQSILQIKLGDSIDQHMTAMFCDIRSYSALSENGSPQESFRFINDYLIRIGPVIRRNGGFINHYLGDGFIALFKDKAEDALNAAVQMQEEITRYNEERVQAGRMPMAIGIGLHSGRVMMGIIGDYERHDANVLSDAVNIASRMEGLTKVFGANIILSDATLKSISNHEHLPLRYLGKIKVKGKEQVIDVYEMFGAQDNDIKERKQKTLALFHSGMNDYYSRNFAEAAVLLKKVLNENAGDRTARRYLENAARYMISGVPENWDGVEEISEK